MQIIAIASSFGGLSTFFVGLRQFTRFYLIKNPGIDDYTIAVAVLFAWCSFAFLVQEVQYGVGQPMATLTGDEIKLQLRALWLSIPFYNLSLTLTKAAIVFLYLRLFPTRKFIIAARIVLVVIVIYGLWTVISAFLNCLPVQSFWDQSVPGHCISKTFLWFFNGGWNIATDLAILILPVPVLSHLKLPRRQKFGVILIFATGGFACVTSMIRLNYLTIATHTTDPTKDNGPIATWSQIELNMGIICSCLPPLQPLVTRVFPRLLNSASRSRGENPYPRPSYSGKESGRNLMHRLSRKDNKIYRVDEVTVTQELRMETLGRGYGDLGREYGNPFVSETESERGLVQGARYPR
ncbi:uncharacterized protein BJX67DRAFT_382013 [Aspergillus lucknowensis]|uniref:Rhodopsin domain-containing protein n=1 Tax=Aspergillus lucknowensis TaxID=176173 RepID=A0ABR4LNT2_9EURO